MLLSRDTSDVMMSEYTLTWMAGATWKSSTTSSTGIEVDKCMCWTCLRRTPDAHHQATRNEKRSNIQPHMSGVLYCPHVVLTEQSTDTGCARRRNQPLLHGNGATITPHGIFCNLPLETPSVNRLVTATVVNAADMLL